MPCQHGPEGLGATDKFMMLMMTVGLNTTELNTYCLDRGL